MRKHCLNYTLDKNRVVSPGGYRVLSHPKSNKPHDQEETCNNLHVIFSVVTRFIVFLFTFEKFFNFVHESHRIHLVLF